MLYNVSLIFIPHNSKIIWQRKFLFTPVTLSCEIIQYNNLILIKIQEVVVHLKNIDLLENNAIEDDDGGYQDLGGGWERVPITVQASGTPKSRSACDSIAKAKAASTCILLQQVVLSRTYL